MVNCKCFRDAFAMHTALACDTRFAANKCLHHLALRLRVFSLDAFAMHTALAGDTRFATSVIMITRMLAVRTDLEDTVDDEIWKSHLQAPTAGRRRSTVRAGRARQHF